MKLVTEPTLQASVIVCAYTQERWDGLVAAVGSIQHQETPAGELIVVIDHNPELLEKAQAQFPDIQVVENHGPRGLSGARNTGIENARHEVIAFMDEDAVAAPDWLTQLLSNYSNEQVIGVGGTVAPNWQGGRPVWFPDEFAWVVGCTYKGLPEAVEPVRNMLGCNMSFRRKAFDSVGGFRNNLGRLGKHLLSCEETEFCIRVNRRFPQGHFVHAPQARVIHTVPAQRASWQYYRARCYAEGLSKALVANYVGTGDGLASERKYATRTLPLGMLNGIGDCLLKGDLSGLLRASAIAIGLGMTTLGYLAGAISVRPGRTETPPLKTT
jgi:GT2 family glycosyltransferase